jgi:phosphatidate cytidylyltransferase
MRMSDSTTQIVILGIFGGLSLIILLRLILKKPFLFSSYLKHTWVFFLSIALSMVFSFAYGLWVLAVLSFLAIREYFSLVDIRLQDRLGILGAYLSIPFMYYFIHIDWYGMFIISIPVYAFLAVPLLVTLGGKQTEGTIFSIGAIDFGLFLFVYCLGHIGYLLSYSVWMPTLLILNVAICDLIARVIDNRNPSITYRILGRLIIPLPLTIGLAWLVAPWTEIPIVHSLILGAMIPTLVAMGQHTGDYVKADLGVTDDDLFPGRGQILDNLKSFFFAAPIVFHYIRYFLK